ncbi:calcium sensing receptor chloroplastic, partial [Phtheirospermum japonicum]
DGLPVDPPILPDLLNTDENSLSGQDKNVADIISEINKSTADIISGGENVLNSLFDNVTSSVTKTLTNANEAVDNAVNEIFSFFNKSGESAGDKLTGLSGELKDVSGKTGLIALDFLKKTIVVVEDSLVEGAKNVGYAYSSAKNFLPPEFREVLNLSEESVAKVLNPAGTAFRQVYMAVEGFEERLGLDPNDPLIPFVLFFGLSATLWGSYRILKYSGYAGDLSPQETFDLLRGNEDVVLVDIRPENLRERDGIPDLRRTARFRYTCVTLPKIDGSLKKLLKGGRDVDDTLLSVVIRNLKIVEGRSKVLVMDADGTRSKGVARSLRKLGTKRPYQVQGGFRSWANEGFRIKMLKPETALTILNEEAEAILEEINPTPLKVIGYGVGLAAAAYSLAEWENTLQFIGVIGLGQTIYRRLVSYQDANDFKQDVRLLLAPVRLGGQAFSWAAGKIDTNRNGLPTSPSSSDVQSRVLQAAAKHESQPSDPKEF